MTNLLSKSKKVKILTSGLANSKPLNYNTLIEA